MFANSPELALDHAELVEGYGSLLSSHYFSERLFWSLIGVGCLFGSGIPVLAFRVDDAHEGIALLSVLVGLFFLVIPVAFAISERGKALFLFERGLAFRQNGKASFQTWEDVQTLDLTIASENRIEILPADPSFRTLQPLERSLAFVLKNGCPTTLHFSNFEDFTFNSLLTDRYLGSRTILERFVRSRCGEIDRNLFAGQAVWFGCLGISWEGVEHARRGTLLPWQDLCSVKIDDTRIYLVHRTQLFSWAAVRLKEVPNLPLFIYALYICADDRGCF